MILSELIKNINELGYSLEQTESNCNSTSYIIISKGDEQMFKIRISDHDLNPGNYLPAGVINEYYEVMPISFKNIEFYIKSVSDMDKDDFEYLWENRLIIHDPEYPSLIMIEPRS